MEQLDYRIMYPELSEEGQKKTQDVINKFKAQLEDLINNTLYSFTCNLGNEIVNDDSWINVREQTRAALCNYSQSQSYNKQDWVRIREQILNENRDQIITDIISDKEAKIQELQTELYREQERNRSRY